MNKRMFMFASAALLAFAVSGSAMAQKKTLAVVVKGLDNPFFTVLGNGCALWNKENPTSEYTCLYTGPASSADEAGEVQLVEDLINKGVAGIAISPSNAPAMANMLKAKKPKMPIMTIDADLGAADRSLRKTYLGTNNYDMGVLMAKYTKELKPKGGTVCLQLGNVAADNINARAQGFRDTISGKKGIDRLKGENGWTEIKGCPVFTNDQIDLANQQMQDTFTANPNLDAFILIGGWAQFGPQAYAQVTDQVMAKLKSKQLVIIAGDTLPPQMAALKAGRSMAQIGQRPFEMGHKAPSILIDLINGKKVADPLYTGLDECTPANLGKCPAQ
jgi:ribose transport system substrate-binding protein